MTPKTTTRMLRYSICVSGAHSGDTVDKDKKDAMAIGTAIAKSGHVLTTGATVGLPYFCALAAKNANGMSIGFSPAASLREHLRKYRLPYDCYDFVNFTGLHYVGRDLYLVQSSDAVITIGGGFGTMHEFTSALEAGKPCGILTGSGGTADTIPELMRVLDGSFEDLVVYDDDPVKLVAKVIDVVDAKYHDIRDQLLNRDEHWFLHEDAKSIHLG